uniref:olfactory receptor 1571-like isoform X2 n=1 Tax=Ictidomys tridecemlineatus TaxID=43179 RepID=UPI001A9CD049|nr:olfactory receptor 1571-like isoform X2 [Ictidomys tridecemlineatus]
MGTVSDPLIMAPNRHTCAALDWRRCGCFLRSPASGWGLLIDSFQMSCLETASVSLTKHPGRNQDPSGDHPSRTHPGLDIYLLTVMAYDRYVAICYPLHYMVIMNSRRCGLLVLVSWIMSALHSLLQGLMMLRLSFCTDLQISHFFCELNHLVHLACSDTFLNEVVIYFAAVLLAGGPFTGILYSYCKISSSIRAISSAQGKYKAFSTCASHLSVVSLFYCTSLGVYLSSAVAQNSHSTATASVMYSVVTPMLNPFIYSLRNKDIKSALRRLCERETVKATVVLRLKKCP